MSIEERMKERKRLLRIFNGALNQLTVYFLAIIPLAIAAFILSLIGYIFSSLPFKYFY